MVTELVPTATVVDAETETTDPSDLWALSRLFTLSWSSGFGISTTWFTESETANNGAEKRISVSGKPSRTVRFTLQSMNRRETWLILNALKRAGMARSYVPIYSDFTKTSQQAYFGWSPQINNGAGVNSTGTVILNLTTYSTPTWNATSQGIVAVTPGGVSVASNVDTAPVYSTNTSNGVVTLVSPGHVTYTVPARSRIVLPTTGPLSQTAPYNVTISGPGGSTNVAYGATNIDVGAIASAIGVAAVQWSDLNLSVFQAMGVVNAQNTASFDLNLIGIGVSYATVAVPQPVTFSCDTTNRRFFIGGQVVVAIPSRTTEISIWEIGTIADMGPTFLALSSGITRVYPPGTRIFPLIECQIVLGGSIAVVTDRLMSVNFLAKESEGPECLPPLIERSASSPYPVQNGYPVFYTQLQWANPPGESYRTDVRTTKSGTGDIYEVIGSRPRYLSSRKTYTVTRDAGWKILTFFDYVCGSAWPFFVLSVMSPFEYRSVGTGSITISAAGPRADWNEFTYIAVVQRSTNTPYVLPIASVTRSTDGTMDTVSVSGTFPIIPANDIRSVNPAYLVRFSSDELEEYWVTDTNLSLTFGVVEVFQESAIIFSGS